MVKGYSTSKVKIHFMIGIWIIIRINFKCQILFYLLNPLTTKVTKVYTKVTKNLSLRVLCAYFVYFVVRKNLAVKILYLLKDNIENTLLHIYLIQRHFISWLADTT